MWYLALAGLFVKFNNGYMRPEQASCVDRFFLVKCMILFGVMLQSSLKLILGFLKPPCLLSVG